MDSIFDRDHFGDSELPVTSSGRAAGQSAVLLPHVIVGRELASVQLVLQLGRVQAGHKVCLILTCEEETISDVMRANNTVMFPCEFADTAVHVHIFLDSVSPSSSEWVDLTPGVIVSMHIGIINAGS